MGWALWLGSAAVVLAAFSGLSALAQRGNTPAALAGFAVVVVAAAAGGIGAFIAFVIAAIQCDDGCDPHASEWWHHDDAAQWLTQLGVAWVGTLLLVLAAVHSYQGRHRFAPIWMAIAAVCFAGWATMVAPLGDGVGI